MQAKLQKQVSPADAEVILGRLPERIKAAPIARAAEIEAPIAAAIAIQDAGSKTENRCQSLQYTSLTHPTRAAIYLSTSR